MILDTIECAEYTPCALETVREQVALITKAIEQMDSATSDMIEARWRMEMVGREPSLGRTQRGIVTVDDLATNITTLAKTRDTALAVLLFLTGTESADEAREAFLRLISAYQRFGEVIEIKRMVMVGSLEARERAAKEFGADCSIGDLETEVEEARETLAMVSRGIPTPALTVFEVPARTGIILNG
jgi:hypothetical protein